MLIQHQEKSSQEQPATNNVSKAANTPETTYAGKTFSPPADIVETKNALIVTLDMPGVEKDHVQIKLENDVLEIEGKVDLSSFERIKPIYSEYNMGHYYRRFAISNKINRDLIEAKMVDGVLTLTLPKAAEFGPKKIAIS